MNCEPHIVPNPLTHASPQLATWKQTLGIRVRGVRIAMLTSLGAKKWRVDLSGLPAAVLPRCSVTEPLPPSQSRRLGRQSLEGRAQPGIVQILRGQQAVFVLHDHTRQLSYRICSHHFKNTATTILYRPQANFQLVGNRPIFSCPEASAGGPSGLAEPDS